MMKNNHHAIVPQPKDEALKQAVLIKKSLQRFDGQDLGYGLVYHDSALLPSFNKTASSYLLAPDGKPVTFYHYRNLSTVSEPGYTGFHDLMHFGTLRAAYSRAFSKRLLQSDQQFSEALLGTEIFNQCANTPIRKESDFGDEVIIAAHIRAAKPYFIPDIGQTNYFRNRAVLYACGLFDDAEVDRNLFDQNGFPQEDIDQKVVKRLRERGYDSIAYLNEIEDPDSLSLIILDKEQAVSVDPDDHEFPGFRYRFGSVGSDMILEYDTSRNAHFSKISNALKQ